MLFDGTTVTVLTGGHVDTPNTHGTGCSLSAAITAYLAHGADVPEAVSAAKAFVLGALRGGARLAPRARARAPGPPGMGDEATAGHLDPGVSSGPRTTPGNPVLGRASRYRPLGSFTVLRHDSGRALRPGHSPPISQDPSAVLVQAPLLGTNRHRSSVHLAL